MKSLRKLQDAYAKLDWAKDDVNRGNYQGLDTLLELIKQELNEFMVDNERTPKGEFNIWDWIANDDLRPVMNGVLHDKKRKMAVATNAHMLVADANVYDENKVYTGFAWEGEVSMDKYGKFIDGRFPDWEAVVPQESDEFIHYDVPLADVTEYLKKYNAYIKLNRINSKYAPRPLYKVGETYFHAEYLRTFLTASGGHICINEKSTYKKGVYWSEKRIALIMPMLGDNFDEDGLKEGLYLTTK